MNANPGPRQASEENLPVSCTYLEGGGCYRFLSRHAFENLQHQGQLPRNSRLVESAAEILGQCIPGLSWIAVVADVGQIDDTLTRKIYEFQRRSGVLVGIIPYDEGAGRSLAEMLLPAKGRDLSELDMRGFAVHGHEEQKDGLSLNDEAKNSFRWLHKDSDFESEIISKELDAFAAVLNGRQTFLFLGDHHALHPGLPKAMPSVYEAKDLKVRNWFLQSCHSPFVWPDFGDYWSLPLALILKGCAHSVIASCRVQTFVPHVLRAYLELAVQGIPLGKIALSLNQLAEDNHCDCGPFVLLGHPASVVAIQPVEANLTQSDAFIESKREAKMHARAVRRSAANLLFSAYPPHFSFNEGSQVTRLFRQQTEQLARSYGHRLRTVRFATAETQAAPELRISTEFDAARGINVPTLHDTFAKVSSEHRGYYYHLSEFVEKWYEPTDCFHTESNCLACGSSLMSRRLSYVGPFPCKDYTTRVQLVCPRCLIVSDIVELNDATIQLRAESTSGDEYQFVVEVANTSDDPRFVRVEWKLNDPNNASRKVAPRITDDLLKPVIFQSDTNESIAAQNSRSLHVATLNVVGTDLFYLLVEVNVFVDGIWNWLSFTVRRPKIAGWLASKEYLETLPHL